MTPSTAMCTLGLLGPATELTAAEVTTAYRNAVKWRGVDANIQDLQAARTTLLDVISGQNNRCVWCGGAGMVSGRMGMRACEACKGTGDRR